MQTFKTVTKQIQPIAVDSVHYTVAHAVLENAQKQIADLCLDTDPTGARQYIMYANIFASLTDCYYSIDYDSEYVALDDLMQCFAHLTYYDDSYIYDECVANTALEKIKLLDYVYLSN
jgi:hypothetical protein